MTNQLIMFSTASKDTEKSMSQGISSENIRTKNAESSLATF